MLLALGLVPLSLSWNFPFLRYAVLGFDILLITTAIIDFLISHKLPENFNVTRILPNRFSIGSKVDINLHIENGSNRDFYIKIKDEYPPEMTLNEKREAEFGVVAQTTSDFYYSLSPPKRGKYKFGKTAVRFFSKLGLVWCQSDLGSNQIVKVYPNMSRAQETEMKALGANSYIAAKRKSVRRGEGREFESMRDYVGGDELRHISWTTTARRAKLTTRQYQIERDQTIIIALDAGRLMTARIDSETKLDTAIHASLALMLAAAKSGDNCGLVTFGRGVKKFIPPQKGIAHIEETLEALHDLEPELVEPSYSQAFQFISVNSKKRSFVVILTDLVSKESSKELINSLRLLRPTHLPLVATIGDRDLNTIVSEVPKDIKEFFIQSTTEEIILQRDLALRQVEALGGLTLDVTTSSLAPSLLETYLRVKERGRL